MLKLYEFKRIEKGRYEAIDPDSRQPLGIVYGGSKNWRAEQLDGVAINNAYATKRDAAHALSNGLRSMLRLGNGAGQEQSSPEFRHAALSAKFEVERQEMLANLMSRAASAAKWISENRPDLTFGAEPSFRKIADPDSGSLAEFEDYGRAGDAVLFHESALGQIWWLNPEGQEVKTSKFAFTAGPAAMVSYEIWFSTKSAAWAAA